MTRQKTSRPILASGKYNPSENLGLLVCQHLPSAKLAVIDLYDFDRPRRYTYNDIQRMIDAAAASLQKMNLSYNSRIGILAENSVEYLVVFFAIMSAGFICVPLNIRLTKSSIDDIIQDADIGLLFYDTANAAHISPTGNTGKHRLISSDKTGWFHTEFLAASEKVEPVTCNSGDDGFFLYTSGSTGRPKGVPLSHSGQHWALRQAAFMRDELREHTCLIAAPLYHMNGLWNAKLVFEVMGSMVLMPRFDAVLFARAISKYHCTWITSVPTMIALMMQEHQVLDELDFGHVSRVTMGSAPITISFWHDVQATFPNATLYNGYGTTEHGAAAFGEHPDGLPRPPLSIGVPTPDTEVRLLHGPSENQGTLHVKGPANFRGYHKLPKVTAERVNAGWYDTGDIMLRDKDGFFFFKGRDDDMFNCGGENIYPGELEKILEANEAIRQVCVVPIPYGAKGEAPFAFVVLKNSANVTAADVRDYALAHAPAFMHPRGIEFVSELPLIGTHKIDRNRLRLRALRTQRR